MNIDSCAHAHDYYDFYYSYTNICIYNDIYRAILLLLLLKSRLSSGYQQRVTAK